MRRARLLALVVLLVTAARGAPAADAGPAADAFQEALARRARANVPGDIYLPVLAPAVEPETRQLAPAEAADALERDWLFQAVGEPLAARTRKEIAWARELAARLGRTARPPDLSAEVAELDALQARLAAEAPAGAAVPGGVDAAPAWIWFPEGRPFEDAPVAPRFFRRTFDVPAGVAVRWARLRIAADDACEVFLNGARLGSHETWQRAAGMSMGRESLRPGRNVLAVRAENRAAPVTKNPAGLIARLTLVLADDRRMSLVSDPSWRAATEAPTGWHETAFDDSAWPAAAVTAPLGGGP